MKYKQIHSAIHNFGHSFVSFNNYVDGEFILDLLPQLLRELPGNTLTVRFPAGTIEPDREYPSTLRKSVAYWAASYTDQLRSQGIDPDGLIGLCLVLSLAPGLRCEARAIDDRRRVHSVLVKHA
jgi:hypothetical protein